MPVNLQRPSVPTGGPEPGTIRSLRIEVADGGFLVSCDRVPPKSSSGDMVSSMYDSQQKVMTSIADLHAYIDEELGDDGSMAKDAGADTESDE